MIYRLPSLSAAHWLLLFSLAPLTSRAAQPAAPPLPKHDPESPVEAALHEKVNWEFVEVPLSEVADKIKAEQKINVVFDTKALEEAGAGTDTPITFKLSGVTLRSALRLVLAQLDLAFVGEGRVLTITTPEKANNFLTTKVYEVHDLVGESGNQDIEALIEVITTTLAPTTWDEVGGPGSIKAHRQSLVISQTQEVDEQIQQFLTALRKVKEAAPRRERAWAEDTMNVAAMEQIQQKLARRVTLNWTENPLADAMDAVQKEYLIPVQFDKKALEEAGAGTDTPVSLQVTDVALGNALKVCLQRLDLTYIIRDEVLLITTPEKANNFLQVAVYPVADLVSQTNDEADADYEHLQEVITTTIAPTTWDEVGGPGSIKAFENAGSLVISQTQEVHEQLADLFAKLRAKQAKPVAGAAGDSHQTESRDSERRDSEAGGLVVRIYLLKSGANAPVVAKGMAGAGGFFQVEGPPNPQAAPPQPKAGLPQPAACTPSPPEPGNPKLAAELALAIKEVVDPASWDVRGTTIRPVAGNLVVRQTPAVHRKIADFLKKLGVWAGQR